MSPSLTFILFYCLIALSFTPSRSQQVIQFGTSGNDEAYGITSDTTNAVYVTGYTSGALFGTSAGYDDVFVRKYDANGNEQWTKQFGTSSYDRANGITSDTTNAVYVAGSTTGAFNGASAGGYDAFYTFFGPPMTAEPTAAPTQQIAGGKSKSKSRLNVGIVVGAGIGVGLCLVAIGAVYLYFIRKKSNDGKNVSDDIKFTMVDNKGDVVLKNIEVSQEDIEFAKVDNVEEVVVKNNGVQENNI